jgi:hypothetical protein
MHAYIWTKDHISEKSCHRLLGFRVIRSEISAQLRGDCFPVKAYQYIRAHMELVFVCVCVCVCVCVRLFLWMIYCV